MNSKSYFPVIRTEFINGVFRATAGMDFMSILSADLSDLSKNKFNYDEKNRKSIYFHDAYTALLQKIATWTSDIILELHFASLPDLVHIIRGKINISIFLHAMANNENDAKEKALNCYIILQTLINSHIAEVELSAISDFDTLENRLNSFKPSHAVSVARRREKLSLATPLHLNDIGFRKKYSVKKDNINPDDFCITYCFPWIPSLNDMRRLIEIFLCHPSPLKFVVRLRSPKEIGNELMRLEDLMLACEDFISYNKDFKNLLLHRAKYLRDAVFKRIEIIKESRHEMGVFLFSNFKIDNGVITTLGQTITSGINGDNPGELLAGGFSFSEISVSEAINVEFFPDYIPYTSAEAACAFRFPFPPVGNLTGIRVKHSRTSFFDIPNMLENLHNSVIVGNNIHRGLVQPVLLNNDSRFQHMAIWGQTGTGKSTLMENLIIQDINAGRGLCLIDPHGSLVDNILDKFPNHRAEDVILIDFLDRDFPFPMNLLRWNTIEERDFIIDDLIIALKNIYSFIPESFGPFFEHNFRGMMGLLMGDTKRKDFVGTLLELNFLFLDKKFRDYCLRKITDQQLIDCINGMEKTTGDCSLANTAPYITSKISRFTHDSVLRRIVGQEEMSLDFEDIMNSSKILLINLGKGRFGGLVSDIIASMIISRIKAATMARANISTSDRKDFFLYVDEFQNIANESFNELLSESRKYRLGLVLASQYCDQIKKGTLEAIKGNVGSIISFRLGHKDAENMEEIFYPIFNRFDLMQVPDRECYARFHLKNYNIQPFSMHTIKNNSPINQENAEMLHNLSRKKYCKDVKTVDNIIHNRRNKILSLIE